MFSVTSQDDEAAFGEMDAQGKGLVDLHELADALRVMGESERDVLQLLKELVAPLPDVLQQLQIGFGAPRQHGVPVQYGASVQYGAPQNYAAQAPTMTVTGVDMNRDGILDVLQHRRSATPLLHSKLHQRSPTPLTLSMPRQLLSSITFPISSSAKSWSRPSFNRSFTATTSLRSVRKLLCRSGERPMRSQFVASSVGLLVGLGRYLCAGTAHSAPGT